LGDILCYCDILPQPIDLPILSGNCVVAVFLDMAAFCNAVLHQSHNSLAQENGQPIGHRHSRGFIAA